MANIGISDTSLYGEYVRRNGVDNYARIERELQMLSDADIAELMQFKPYLEANNQMGIIIQGELLKLVRMQVNQHYDAIDNVVKSIQQFKENKDMENRGFQDYIKNYSHMTYQDYIKMKKNENGRVKE
jgi:hypothetical protein